MTLPMHQQKALAAPCALIPLAEVACACARCHVMVVVVVMAMVMVVVMAMVMAMMPNMLVA